MALDEIDKKIVAYLNKEDWPVTTVMVAKKLTISWDTAQLHLYKILSDDLVKFKRIGRQNQWMISEKGHNILN